VLVPGAGCPAAATARADETEHRMVVRKRNNSRSPATTRAGPNGADRDEPSSMLANAREVAPLNQPPDGRTRDAECSPRLLNADRFSHDVPIVSQSSHRLNRLMTGTQLARRRPRIVSMSRHLVGSPEKRRTVQRRDGIGCCHPGRAPELCAPVHTLACSAAFSRTRSPPRRSSAGSGLGHSRHAPTVVIPSARITRRRIAAMRISAHSWRIQTGRSRTGGRIRCRPAAGQRRGRAGLGADDPSDRRDL
jgi:hypothetical protein